MFKKNFSKFTSLLLGTIIIGGSIFMSNATVNAAGINGWKANASNWYYYKDGAKATGWLKDGTTWYYLNNNGAMAQGWLLYNSKWYYLNSNGSMAKGWLLNKSRWYYLNEDGAMASNITKDNWEAGADGIFIETLKVGQTVTIKDTVFGTYELTVNSIEITNERNQFEQAKPVEVYKVTYTYKLISRGTSADLGLYVYEFNTVVDNNGNSGNTYPDKIVKTPKELVNVGDSCTAETFVGVYNSTSKLVLTKQYFNPDGVGTVKFIIPTK